LTLLLLGRVLCGTRHPPQLLVLVVGSRYQDENREQDERNAEHEQALPTTPLTPQARALGEHVPPQAVEDDHQHRAEGHYDEEQAGRDVDDLVCRAARATRADGSAAGGRDCDGGEQQRQQGEDERDPAAPAVLARRANVHRQ
jgi:hypothetical protein